jgi:hypothetical protein
VLKDAQAVRDDVLGSTNRLESQYGAEGVDAEPIEVRVRVRVRIRARFRVSLSSNPLLVPNPSPNPNPNDRHQVQES